MSSDFDVCVIGSGAGGGPVAYTLSHAGYDVVVIEKGPFLTEKDFFKDEISDCRRKRFLPKQSEQRHVVELKYDDEWKSTPTNESSWNLWNGSMVGGASNLMSGFFQRLKPIDFHQLSEFGPIEGTNVVDWPIQYEDLEPYYDKVERVVGVSGRVVDHPHAEPRSSKDFPYPPTVEHPISGWFDRAGKKLGVHSIPLPRAVLPYPVKERHGCSYSGFCGDYGCATGAKGSSRAALLNSAIATGRCEVRPECMAKGLISDTRGKVTHLEYIDADGETRRISAKIFVVACQPIETSRLLLLSVGPKHPQGIGNNRNQVGKNLLFSAASGAEGTFTYENFSPSKIAELKAPQPFINRSFQDWYQYKDKVTGKKRKGGTLDFMFLHPNPISLANFFAFSSKSKMVWGWDFKKALKSYCSEARHVVCEIFCDWLPVPDCHVTLDSNVKDKWGLPVAKVRIFSHAQNEQTGDFLNGKAEMIFKAAGADLVEVYSSGAPATNLVAGTCRFGEDPETSVLDSDCRIHDCENVYVTDGSFMPTGGSVPYTWTIYANSFRVSDKILKALY